MKTRWLLFLLCGCAALSAAGQTAEPGPTLRTVIRVPGVTEMVLKMPDVRWLNQQTAAVTLREALQRVPAFTGDGGPVVVAQEPPPGADVDPDTKIVLTLGVPRLFVTASTTTPAVDEPVTFEVAVEPPWPEVTYNFAWGDGSEETTSVPEAAHPFAEARDHEVTVHAVARGVVVGPAVARISPLVPLPPPPPPLDSAGTAVTDATVRGPDTATSGTVRPPIETDTTVAPPPTTRPPAVQPTPDTRRPSLVPWLIVAAILLAVVAAAALARAVWRKPPAPAAVPPRVSIRSGLGSTEHTIEHPERIRNGLSLRLRGGVRAAVAGEGGADA